MAVWQPFGGGVVGGHGRAAPVALEGVLARVGEGTEKGGRARIAANAPPVTAVVPSFLFYSFVLLCCYYVQSPFPWGNLWGGCGVRPPHVSYVIQFVDGHLFRSLFYGAVLRSCFACRLRRSSARALLIVVMAVLSCPVMVPSAHCSGSSLGSCAGMVSR